MASSVGDTNVDPSTQTGVVDGTIDGGVGASIEVIENTKVRKKPYKKKSDVWDHFTTIKKEGGEKSDKATCNYCGIQYSCSSANGTSTVWKHLRKCFKYPFNEDKRQKTLNLKTSFG